MASTYSWTAHSGVWSNAADWADITAGTAGITAPGSADTATISGPLGNSFFTIGGPGAAATLTVTNTVALTGSIALSLGIIGGTAAVLAGGTLSAASLIDSNALIANGAGAAVVVSGTLTESYESAMAVNGGSIRVGTLSANSGDMYVDPTGTFEIGSAGGAAAGALTVDAGPTVYLSGQIYAPVVDNGVITSNGVFNDAVTGTGTVATQNVSSPHFNAGVGAGITIAFNGFGGQVALEAPASVLGEITGFAAGDAFAVNAPGITGVAYAATGATTGTLGLLAGSTTLASLNLAGTYTAGSFLVLPFAGAYWNAKVYLAVNAPTAPVAAPAGANAHGYSWNNANGGGSWSNATLWLDGSNTAVAAPGSQNAVTIASAITGFEIINGDGNSASLTLSGQTALNGRFTTGALTLLSNGAAAQYGALDLLAGSTLAASGTVTDDGSVEVAGANTTLSAGGAMLFGDALGDAGLLNVAGGGFVRAGALGLSAGTPAQISVDGTSTFEIGTAGGAAAGRLTVDAGAVANLQGEGAINANLTVNGTLAATPGLYNIAASVTGDIDGSGTLLIAGNASLGASLQIAGNVGSGVTIAFAGSGDALNILASPTVAASITGFAIGDNIVAAIGLASVTYASGTLSLHNAAGATTQTLNVLGSFGGDSFIAAPNAIGDKLGDVVLAAGTLLVGPAPSPAPGTATTDTYIWTADGGAWATATNWTDSTAGQAPALFAPGSNDIVAIPTLAAGPTNWQVISGAGNAASLAVSGNVALSGAFDAGLLTVTSTYASVGEVGAVVVQAGGTLQVGNGTDSGTLAVNGAGAAILGSGTLSIGATASGYVEATGGGLVRFAAMAGTSTINSFYFGVDSASTIDIGAPASAFAGAVNIASGSSFAAGGGEIDGNVVNNGTLAFTGSYVTIKGNIAGTGVIALSNATLQIGVAAPSGLALSAPGGGTAVTNTGVGVGTGGGTGGTIVAGQTILLSGTSSIQMIQGGVIGATIEGLLPGDVFEINQEVTGASWSATSHMLTLSNDGTTVSTLNLAGDYSWASFLAIPTIYGSSSVQIACFTTGTRIDTARGAVAVEALAPGDLARTLDGGLRRIVWIGHRRLRPRRHARPDDVQPVRVHAGAFGAGLPMRDLDLSPDHAVYVEDDGGAPGVLIPVRHLVNGTSIVRRDVAEITYWHVELDRHDILLAEGLPAESYLDTGNRAAFESGRLGRAYPGLGAAAREAYGYADLVVGGARLDAIRKIVACR